MEMKKHQAWIWMAAIAIACMVVHFVYGWHAFVEEANAHNQTAEMASYRIEWMRDTFENLQSEFWQLAVQFLVLAGVLKAIGLQEYEESVEVANSKVDDLRVIVNNI